MVQRSNPLLSHHGGKKGGTQADMVLEKELRVLYAAGDCEPLSPDLRS